MACLSPCLLSTYSASIYLCPPPLLTEVVGNNNKDLMDTKRKRLLIIMPQGVHQVQHFPSFWGHISGINTSNIDTSVTSILNRLGRKNERVERRSREIFGSVASVARGAGVSCGDKWRVITM